jgi:SAM-dependent methyltransferase
MDRSDWNRRYQEKDIPWSDEPNRFLVEEAGSLEPRRALDVACGAGRNAVWLAEKGWEVDAVDFSDVAIEQARSLGGARNVDVNWIVADIERDWAPVERAYDLVIVFYLQVPLESMRRVIRRCAAAVAPDGTFLLVGHDLENLDKGHGGPWNPDVLYTPDDVVSELSGLEVLEADRRLRPVETEDGTVNAIDCLVRAVRESSRPSVRAEE